MIEVCKPKHKPETSTTAMASAAPTTPAGGGSSVAGGAGGGGGGGRGLGEGTAAVGTVISGEDDVRQLEAALSKRRRQFSAHHLKVCMQVAPPVSPPSTTCPTHRECTAGMRARVPGTMQASSLVHYTSRGTTASHDSKQCPSTHQAEFAPHDSRCCRCLLLFMLLCCIFQAKFKYACMLTDSGNNKRLRDGVALLQGTAIDSLWSRVALHTTFKCRVRAHVRCNQQTEVMDTGFDQNACLFELAVAYKRLGHMVITVASCFLCQPINLTLSTTCTQRTSRQHIERLLRRSPDDKQGMAFHRSLRRTVRRGTITMDSHLCCFISSPPLNPNRWSSRAHSHRCSCRGSHPVVATWPEAQGGGHSFLSIDTLITNPSINLTATTCAGSSPRHTRHPRLQGPRAPRSHRVAAPRSHTSPSANARHTALAPLAAPLLP